jgi:hypothetical protein
MFVEAEIVTNSKKGTFSSTDAIIERDKAVLLLNNKTANTYNFQNTY